MSSKIGTQVVKNLDGVVSIYPPDRGSIGRFNVVPNEWIWAKPPEDYLELERTAKMLVERETDLIASWTLKTSLEGGGLCWVKN